MFGRGTGPEQAQLADLHAWPQLDREGRDVGQLKRHVAGEAGVDPACGRVREQAEPAETRLALQPPGDVVRQRDDFVGGGEDKLTRVQDEGLLAVGLDQACQVWLLYRRVDVRVAVVLEHPEVPVQPDVDAGRLDELRCVRVELHPPGTDLGLDVTIREQHASNLPCPVPYPGKHCETSAAWLG